MQKQVYAKKQAVTHLYWTATAKASSSKASSHLFTAPLPVSCGQYTHENSYSRISLPQHKYSIYPLREIQELQFLLFSGTNKQIKNKNLSCSLVRNDSISN